MEKKDRDNEKGLRVVSTNFESLKPEDSIFWSVCSGYHRQLQNTTFNLHNSSIRFTDFITWLQTKSWHMTDNKFKHSTKRGVSKLQPTGRMRPLKAFNTARYYFVKAKTKSFFKHFVILYA